MIDYVVNVELHVCAGIIHFCCLCCTFLAWALAYMYIAHFAYNSRST